MFPLSLWRAASKSERSCSGSTSKVAEARSFGFTPSSTFPFGDTPCKRPASACSTAPATIRKPPVAIAATAINIVWMFATTTPPYPVSRPAPKSRTNHPMVVTTKPKMATGDLNTGAYPYLDTTSLMPCPSVVRNLTAPLLANMPDDLASQSKRRWRSGWSLEGTPGVVNDLKYSRGDRRGEDRTSQPTIGVFS